MKDERKRILLRQAVILHYTEAGLHKQIEHLEKCLNEIKSEVGK